MIRLGPVVAHHGQPEGRPLGMARPLPAGAGPRDTLGPRHTLDRERPTDVLRRTAGVQRATLLRRVIGRLVAGAALAAIFLLVAVAVAVGALRAGGYEVVVVATGSMEPQAAPGDLLVERPHTGDVVVGRVYTLKTNAGLLTHRVVALGKTPGSLVTRGDANPVEDPFTLTTADVVGDPVLIVRKAGIPLGLLGSAQGRLVGLLGVLALCALFSLGLRWAGVGERSVGERGARAVEGDGADKSGDDTSGGGR